MLLFMLILFTLGVVKCSYVSENYIIEMPDIDVPKADNTPFKIYWNVPTKQCRSRKIPFDDLLQKYMITYNKNDKFEGETIAIIYNVGDMPRILESDGAKYKIKNGGLPQEGNLDLHLSAFRETVTRLIPDPGFNGIGVLDMEDWRPIFRQHWTQLAPIINLSLSIEKRRYWWWPIAWQKMEAKKRFEDAARIFMEKTLSTAKQMRPNAVWGYYGYPYCYNMQGSNIVETHCSKYVKEENDRTYWLWAESAALYPSIYSLSHLLASELSKLVEGRLTEANRVKLDGVLVLPYFAVTYRDGGFLSEEDVVAVFQMLEKKSASGLIIWGSSNDVNTVEKCQKLYEYIESSFGPIAKKYIQRLRSTHDTELYEESENEDKLLNFLKKYNYTSDIYDPNDSKIANNSFNKSEMNFTKNKQVENSIYNKLNSPVLTENTTVGTINSTHKNIKNESVILTVNLTNPFSSLDIINVKEIDSKFKSNTKEKEQLLNNYYYETDNREGELKSNESNDWFLIIYNTTSELESIHHGLKNTNDTNNDVGLLIKSSESNYSSPILLSINKTLSHNKTTNTPEIVSVEVNSMNDLNKNTDNLLRSFDGATFSSIAHTVNTLENNIASDITTLTSTTNRVNTSDIIVVTDVYSEFELSTENDAWQSKNYYMTDSDHISSTIETKNHSEDSLQNIKTEDNFTLNTIHPKNEIITSENTNVFNYSLILEDTDKINISDYGKGTVENKDMPENSLQSKLLPLNIYSKDLLQNTTKGVKFTENKSNSNTEAIANGKNDVFDYLITQAEPFSFMNMSMTEQTDRSLDFTPQIQQNKSSKDFLLNDELVKILQTTTDSDVETEIHIEDNVLDYLITLAEKSSSANLSVNNSDTEVTNNV